MAYQGITTSIRQNQTKTTLLLILFPILLFAIVYGTMYLVGEYSAIENSAPKYIFAIGQTLNIFMYAGPVIILRGIICFFAQSELMFNFTGAKPLERKDNPQIYNIVENLCIAKGLPTPKIGIISEPGMNAFATGRNVEKGRIVFTQGLLNNLNKAEIEAVTAHELTHLVNKDCLLMGMTISYIGIISVLGEMLLRIGNSLGRSSSKSNDKGNGAAIGLSFILIGGGLIILGYIIYPLIRLAISRKREFLADAGSVELTKDNQSMISALQKISSNPQVQIHNEKTSSLFIDSPQKKDIEERKQRSSIRDTHPSISERIAALQNY